MGLLQDGKWVDRWYNTKSTGGRFRRREAQFRNWITPDGSAGPSGTDDFAAETGRYHLYISHACPWAHRTAIFRRLKGLENIVSLSVVHWYMADNGWTFEPDIDVIADPVYNATFLYQIYTAALPEYSGRVTVPVLWDKKRQTIVSNESSEIIRMFNSAFDHMGATEVDFYPSDQRQEIEAINQRIYRDLNNGVYKCGFATTQDAYEDAFHALFETLDWLEERLQHKRYVMGARVSEADWRLFTTLVRFDAVYFGHFKCNLRRVADYPNLSGYLRDLYQVPGVAETVKMDHIKRHYYQSHKTINPTGIVPLGPESNLSAPHNRGTL